MAHRDVYAAALPDGEVVVAFVRAEVLPGCVEDPAFDCEFGAAAFDEAGVVVVGDEADFL